MDNQDNQNNSNLSIIIKGGQIKPGVIDPRHLVVPKTPANGDMFYSNGTTFQKLSAGTNGQVLVNSNGVPLWSNTVTGSTGSFAALQITSANVTGATGGTAALGPVGALDGGPGTTAQNGWAVLYVAGVKCWVPVWQ